jgi:pimeloyl-ACP methyl ester carboxylesterase
VLIGALGLVNGAAAQEFSDIQKPKSPLVLESQGSFYVGGTLATKNATELGGLTAGEIVVNQMYVQFMIPQASGSRKDDDHRHNNHGDKGRSEVPVVMMHGGILSGKTYETTPDGRMGWDEYFVRQGHPVYVPDQVARARSGFDQSIYNNVRAGINPPADQPSIPRLSRQFVWVNFRVGPSFGVPFSDTKFFVSDADKFGHQGTPSMFVPPVVPNPNPSIKALADLSANLKGAVILSHSQSGTWGFEAALLNPKWVRGIVGIEPTAPRCSATYTDEQIKTLATVPILVLFGDHLNANYQLAWEDCTALIARIKAVGGNAKVVRTPELGILGNTHMMMMDKNNIQVADVILKWISKNVKPDRQDDDDDHHGHH